MPQPTPEQQRAMQWAYEAFLAAAQRAHENGDHGQRYWSSAVEAVWWARSLDDALRDHIGEAAYLAAQKNDPAGVYVKATTWLRHRYIHEVVITGEGGAKRPLLGGPSDDYLLFISPSNRWLPRAKIRALKDTSPQGQKDDYDTFLADYPIDATMARCRQWFSRVFDACGWPPLPEPNDPTVL